MNFVFTVYTVFFIITTLASFFVASLAWQRRSVKGASELTWLMIAAGFGSFWIILETAALSVEGKILMSKLEYIGGIATPVLYLIFVLRFTGKDKLITTKNIVLLFIIPVAVLLLTVTNEQHNLVWTGFSGISAKTNLMEYNHGIGFWIGYIAYTYLMLIMATIYLLNFIFRRAKAFRAQALVVLVGGVFPWLVSFMYLTGSNPVPGLDLAPVSITLSGMLAAYAILNFRFLDLVPVARETLVETLQDGILAIDEQNRIQDINKAAISFLGIAKKNIIGLNIEAAGATVTLLLQAAIVPEPVEPVEVMINNEIKTFRILKQAIGYQQGSRLVILRDITERVAWQREIKAGEERYRYLFTMFRLMADNTEDFLWAKDLENKYIFCNKTMCERLLMATNVEEPIGKTDIFFADREREAHPENPDWHTFGEICADSDTITLMEQKPQQFDESGNVKGQFLFLDVHKAPIKDEQGNVIGVVGTGRDVTLTKQLEVEKEAAVESLKKSEENLQMINAEKNLLFSIIAHDLRGPFNGFLGLTKVMAEELQYFTMNEIQNMAVKMENTASNLFSLLENLLQWARIEQESILFNPVLIHLQPVIDESLVMIFEQARHKEIILTCTIPDDIVVFADIQMVQTTIRNLTVNAVKYTPKGGMVHLLAKTTDSKSVEISVEDSGIGMSETIIENLFHINVQTNRKGTAGESSTGLGLIICRNFVRKHGSELSIESEVGRGSTFSFTLLGQKK